MIVKSKERLTNIAVKTESQYIHTAIEQCCAKYYY